MAIERRAPSTSEPNVSLAALCVCVCVEWIPRTWIEGGDLRVTVRGPGCAVCPPPVCVHLSLVPRDSGQRVRAVLIAPSSLLVQIGVRLGVSRDLGFLLLVSGSWVHQIGGAGVLFSCISLLFW